MGIINNQKDKFAIESLNKLNLPNALLIIPDGNGRWAKNHNLSVSEGHKQGGRTFTGILKHFSKLNISVLGAWGFSEDNWKRSTEEIKNIMDVVKITTEENLDFMMQNNIKYLVLGKKDRIKEEFPDLYSTIQNAMEKTANNAGKTLAIFLDYGEKYQLEEFAKARMENKELSTYELLSKINLGLPLFDMILRTSGEKRLSGFGPLASLAEFVSVKNNLPEMSDIDIVNALKEFSTRQRRFGARV